MIASHSSAAQKNRLDKVLVDQGLYQTRSRARDAITRGCIRVDNRTISKPGELVHPDIIPEIADPAKSYVSRAALKLDHALKIFELNPSGMHCLDIGASTGGFTQVLLEWGANHVDAVDVGHGQLAASLCSDGRVTNIQGSNARELTINDLKATPQFIVSDVSFISLKLALPAALDLAAPGATGIFLIKPQFEVGKENIGKSGMVRNATIGLQAAIHVKDWLNTHPGWSTLGFEPSPIKGSDGNTEYLLSGRKNA